MITKSPRDPLWMEFRALWSGLRDVGGSFLVGGGYGLILKQTWLGTNPAVQTTVPLERWLDPVPRATKDLDIFVGLDLIGSPTAQAQMSQILRGCGFDVTEQHPRWQFRKRLDEGRAMLVEFHCGLPHPFESHLRTDRVRVKHRPSLGGGGIHGRQNAEAAGADLQPFGFVLEGVAVLVPNPVTWCSMKLAAMRDRWRRAEDRARDEAHRRFQRDEAIKHARDVCRVVAMATRDESDGVPEVIAAVRTTSSFLEATSTCEVFFGSDDGWGAGATKPMWQDADAAVIREVLARWFRRG